MRRGRKIYEPPRYMTVNQAVEQLLEVEDSRQEGGTVYQTALMLIPGHNSLTLSAFAVYTKDTIAVGLARVGCPDQAIIAGTLEELVTADFGGPLHSLVIAGNMHFLEADLVRTYAVNPETFNKHAVILDH